MTSGDMERHMMPVGTETLDLLSIEQAAARLGVSKRQMTRLIGAWQANPAEGVESVKIGWRRLVPPAAVTDYVRRLREQARAGAA